MRELARREAAYPLVRAYGVRLSRGMGPLDHEGRIDRIRRFVLDHFQFHPDPLGTELVGAPTFHLENIDADGLTMGDCDDAATLGAALSMSVGRPARFNVCSYLPTGKLHHVYTEAHDGRRWIEIDPFRSERLRAVPTRSVRVSA